MPTVALLGPQRTSPIVRATVESLGIDGPIGVVTAGWEEREAEQEELAEHLGLPTRNLFLYQRTEEIFALDVEFFAGMRRRNDALRTLQDLYRLRLDHAAEASRELLARDDDPALLVPEVENAIAAIRALDDQHLERVRTVHAEFDDHWRPDERDAVIRARAAAHPVIDDCAAVAIAGGHVAVLANRLRLMGMQHVLRSRPVIAWSAGAMALTDRIVLFHDSPPQGRGFAEVHSMGLGLCPGVVALPHARRRLLLHDPRRVGLLARRLAPARCVALDEGSRADWDGEQLTIRSGARWLDADGAVHQGAEPAGAAS